MIFQKFGNEGLGAAIGRSRGGYQRGLDGVRKGEIGCYVIT